ncbi:50S ribosomal protein L3 N(5)-glutamine methyltransferase [Kushneria phosphatilytica]|uniref:50S ribosomal protein L3 N(5)-glutamine methyltransferase n=1 Tax=Kushneria phosphatilytica TaxID=657387 RepID=A0A1S1NYS0_9GAMM|nr:50S ribosomal protein L3 N(5)-glutamine methyltransferase [Kushneria phosphatilytica]OHV12923.1 ribosomal protein L3 N(5)-glutamine methyltransferase [Kushneria phosphatilytica]QEL10788.1 50S ribosomal protein L3 N(5)-glutamine methyltransferase [Kushneria phosphatilytica]
MPESARSPLDILELPDTTLVEELVTLRDWLRWCQSAFLAHRLHFGHGTDSAWDEAVALVLGALRLPRDVDPAVLDARLLGVERQRIIELTRERITSRRPLPYLLGEAFFAGLPFDVDDSVLIPRSPLAELVENGFAQWFPDRDPAHVLDLCAGSGCIGIATALMMPTSEVMLGELSPEALNVARRNIARYDVGARVRAVLSDLFEGVQGQRFDLIVSNPPYVDRHDMAAMPAEFQHEPRMALEAGDDGLEIVRRVLREARSCLTDDGVLIVEVGNSERHVIDAWPDVPFLWLEFERGGHGVFALTAAELDAFADRFAE